MDAITVHMTQAQVFALAVLLLSTGFCGGFLTGSAFGHNRAMRQMFNYINRVRQQKEAARARRNAESVPGGHKYQSTTPAERIGRSNGNIAPASATIAEIVQRRNAANR